MNTWTSALSSKIENREARVGIIGLGYVGLPLALCAVDAGYRVVGIDISTDRIDSLRRGRSYLADIPEHVLERASGTGRLEFSSDYPGVADLDIIVIAVPTPLAGHAPDLSNVLAAADDIARGLTSGSLVALESTTYPGTTEEVLRPRLETTGLVAGDDFALVFSPERIDPANSRYGIHEIPKIVGGLTKSCTQLGVEFYGSLVTKVVAVGRPREAEMAKLLENTYRQVNIALANEFAMVAKELDIDIWEVIEAAATKPFGFQPFYPGPGIGGHCIAVDPVYLTWRIRELGRAPFRLVELAREIDNAMPHYIARRVVEALAATRKPIVGADVLVLGVTYKPDVADVRESRAIEVLKILREEGADIAFNDPVMPTIEVDGTLIESSSLESKVADADIVVILTHHSSYEWRDIVARAALIFDARGVTRGINDPKIYRL